jgi:hypothetical protein
MWKNKIDSYGNNTYSQLRDIEKRELLYLTKNIFDEINTSYIVSTRAIGNSKKEYFIVDITIQDKNLNANFDKKIYIKNICYLQFFI